MKNFLIGALGGAVVAVLVSILIQRPASFFDKTPSMAFGTIRDGAIFVTVIAAVAAALVCGFIGIFISLQISKEWKWIIAGIIAALLLIGFFITCVNPH